MRQMYIKYMIIEEKEDILRGFRLLMSLVISRSGIRIPQVAPIFPSRTGPYRSILMRPFVAYSM